MFARWALGLAESGRLPDAVCRMGMRRLLGRRLAAERSAPRKAALLSGGMDGPVAPVPEKANEQHYELPPEFFLRVLGNRLKYSACYWPEGVTDLDAAEAAALALVTERAEVADGMRILELGCGWGSLTLWLAERFPAARVTAVSNSALQREFILARAADRGLANLEIITADMNRFDIDRRFDRVVSVEMFEHMRNWPELLRRVEGWLDPEGALFVHVFCHRDLAYPFESRGRGDWMAEHFFTGGLMPAFDLLGCCDAHLRVQESWPVNGRHYARTAGAWLSRLDAQRAEVGEILASCYGATEAGLWLQRWRLFFMACEELFAYAGGEEWLVGHYLCTR